METVLVTAPSEIVDELCAERVGMRPVAQRGAGEAVAVAVGVVAFVGDVASIVVARKALGELLRRVFRRHSDRDGRIELSLKTSNGLELRVAIPANDGTAGRNDGLAIRLAALMLSELDETSGS